MSSSTRHTCLTRNEENRINKKGDKHQTRSLGGTEYHPLTIHDVHPNRRVHLLESKVWELFLSLLLVIPPVIFLAYAGYVKQHEGEKADTAPIPNLRAAAKYGPTVFPILFAGVIGAFLNALATWRLEEGISVVSLEYLLQSRTVLGTITTPFSLQTLNMLAPGLLLLWALSPVGGQASLRLIATTPSTAVGNEHMIAPLGFATRGRVSTRASSAT
ncbi:hypothetical protein K491DRAFT_200622 [Lophiostoma macrostomum CBS 122681]|uniref:Uncharacterized protein n=1 Tax=Lophiostoma macrostomum CBS 122681 TaxID=1314788 RepID=A0A6A6SSN8_9PLEO|nr:hypothetical protein K491DRAFT_200622 [Lophiostoma macrostomum CBS 122681]